MKEKKKGRILGATKKTKNALLQTIPILLGVLILVSISIAAIPSSWYGKAFSNTLLDPIVGALVGSIATGNPLTSYIIGGELLTEGVSLIAVTAFILSWVTVGLIQLPAESALLGKRFAIIRNIISFFFSIIIAIATVFTLGVFA
ncbi:hypothetical protein GOV10_06855 [Candidatus Woesearchaeota archaeon]|nr:hypothetical protein [Candidatus Woesearchaeota archaeon]